MNLENLKESFSQNEGSLKKNKLTLISIGENKENKKYQMKKVLSLAMPSVFSSLIIYFLETINLIFAGKVDIISPYAKLDILNAIGVGNIFMNFGGFLFGLGIITSLETLCSQSYGKNDFKEMSKWVKICNYFMSVYFIFLAIFCLFSKRFIILMGQPENIAYLASYYLFSLIPSFIIQFYLSTITKLLNAQQIYTPILYINIICVLFHPLWCYLFYYVLELHIIGLGLAYDLTSLFMLIMTYVYIRMKELWPPVSLKEITWKEIKVFLKMALECGILSSIDTLGFEIISFLASYLPQDQLDANICVINIYNNIYSISLGFATSITTLVGNFMGENKPKSALKYAKIGILLNFTLTVLISLCCIFFHKYIAIIYINDHDILKISSKLIRLVGIYIIFDAIQIQLCAIIRGIGRQFIGMIIGIIIFIFIQTILCIVFVYVVDLGVYGLWIGQMISVFLASIVYFIIINNSDWEELANEASIPIDTENSSKDRIEEVREQCFNNENNDECIKIKSKC